MGLREDLAYRWRALTGRPRLEDELDEELRFHLEMEIERRMAAGESRERATRAARLEFGAPEAVKERVRDAWGVRLIDETGRDVRGAFRLLQKSPAFSLVALSSLSVGLSVAAVVFSLVDAVLLRPLPFEEPATLVSIEEVTPGGQSFSVSDPNLLDFGAMGESWSGVAGRLYQRPRPALEAGGERLLLEGELVTPSFFEVLGVEAQLGRTFSSASGDDSPREVVLTHGAFARYFGGAESIVGSAIDLDGEPWTVIGVLPPSFRYRKAARDLYMPLILSYASPRGDRRLEGLARLEEGVSLEQAAQELRGISSTLASIYPGSNDEWGVAMKPLDRFLLGEKTRHHQLMLLGAAALLLLLACANVSNLLLARGADRSDEIGLRLALGASRGRLRQQLMLESLVLGLVGGALAAALTLLAMPWVRSLDVDLPRLHEVSFGPRSALFLLLITLAASLLFGLISALRASGSAAAPRSRRQGSGVASARARSLLVMAEVALALMLAFGAGLLLRSFEQLQAFDAGLATGSGSVYLASIDLPAERYSQEDPSTQLFFDRLSDALAARPTIEAVGASMVNPFRGINTQNVVASELERDPKAFHQVRWRSVTPGFFDAAGATLLRGRTLGSRSRGPLETVISESLAERVWPGRNPIGERLRWRLPEGPLLEVVG
ncbi:MAG: ABC transporter permease, partial [Acidobacteriota bacterium]